MFSVIMTSTAHLSSLNLLQVSSFSLKLVKVFLSQFEGLSSEGVTSVQIEKPTRGNNVCDFGL